VGGIKTLGSKVAVGSNGNGVAVPDGKALGSKITSNGNGVAVPGSKALGSKVASNGSGVTIKTGVGLRVAVLATGWKGVVVGVAPGGTVTRYRIVGVLAGSVADGFPKEAEQPVTKRNNAKAEVTRFMDSLLLA
jgi:hypothetical protein